MHIRTLNRRLDLGYLFCNAINNIHVCSECYCTFESSNNRYVCDYCSIKKHKFKQGQGVNLIFNHNHRCEVCGNKYESTNSSNFKRYCSQKCRDKIRNKDRKSYRKKWTLNKKINEGLNIKCIQKVYHNKSNISYYYNHDKSKLEVKRGKQRNNDFYSIQQKINKIGLHVFKEKKCLECDNKINPFKTKSKKYCSKSCSQSATKRINRSKRRALEKNVFIECVDPMAVLNSFDYKCNICGVDTPLSLRGTYEYNAPELDHIKPLSKGGYHSYNNIQLLCRKCNAEKSDKY